MTQTDTIVAIATAQGTSALALLRISGAEAFTIVRVCLLESQRFETAPKRSIRLYTAIHPCSKNAIDEVTAIKYAAPKSFTGEDMVELICHGGWRVIQEIFTALLSAGARVAVRGEFTRRAFLNGKIDLLKAEAIRAIIESRCDAELLCARKYYFNTDKESLDWRNELLEILALVEVRIEFEEADAISEINNEGKEKIAAFLTNIESDLCKREQIKRYERGIHVVIAGPVNAGKSTLFNLLVGSNRSIVHSEPGTTRDLVSERVWINGQEVLLMDSAGIRTTKQEIENEGISRAYEAAATAEAILWVTAADEMFSEWEKARLLEYAGQNILCILNKTDLSGGEKKRAYLQREGIETVCVSFKRHEGIEGMIANISTKIVKISKGIEMPDILLNSRHEELGKALKKTIIDAQEAWGQPEIASYHLKNGLQLLDELYGKTESDEVLNKIFDTFCIGK